MKAGLTVLEPFDGFDLIDLLFRWVRKRAIAIFLKSSIASIKFFKTPFFILALSYVIAYFLQRFVAHLIVEKSMTCDPVFFFIQSVIKRNKLKQKVKMRKTQAWKYGETCRYLWSATIVSNTKRTAKLEEIYKAAVCFFLNFSQFYSYIQRTNPPHQ